MHARLAVLVIVLALAGCRHASTGLTEDPSGAAPAAGPQRAAPGTRAATAAELRVVASLMRETEALRGLAFRTAVDVQIASTQGMRRYVLDALDRTALARARRRYLALGALDPALDLEDVLLGVMEEELIGYYDPKKKLLAVRDDVARALGDQGASPEQLIAFRATVVHELVHALQDQHFDLGRIIALERTTDAENALSALLEGDATLAMIAYGEAQAGRTLDALVAQPTHLGRMLVGSSNQGSDALRRAPALVRDPLLFRYQEGTVFCASIVRRRGFSGIDAAHHAPPVSTWEVLAAGRDAAPEPPATLPLPSRARLQTLGLETVDEDTLGALELGILVDRRPLLARAWRGDRYLVVTRADGEGSLWWIALDSARTARMTRDAFERLGDRRRQVTQRGAHLLVGYDIAPGTFTAVAGWLGARDRPRRPTAQAKSAPTSEEPGFDPLASARHGH